MTRNVVKVGLIVTAVLLAMWLATAVISYYYVGSNIILDATITAAVFAVLTLFSYLLKRITEHSSHGSLTGEHQSSEQTKKNMFNSIFDHSNVGIAILDTDGKILEINDAFCELFGYDEDMLKHMNFFHMMQPEDFKAMQEHIQELREGEKNFYQMEQIVHRNNNESMWVNTTISLVTDDDESERCFVLQVQNISLQKKAEDRLSHMAYHDPLTGLANRNKLEQFVNQILAQSRRHQGSFALVLVDLDRFKNINDTIGHEAGDLLLQVVADRLKSTIRNTDLVARLGGDEFVLVVTEVTKSESVAIIAHKILERVMQPIVIKGQEIYITTSIGISLYPFDGQNMQTLMKNADLALYRAKEHGKNNYQFYTLEMTSKAQQKMSLQNALAQALVKNEFVLHFQPKMELQSRKITGIEALLRWKNRENGLITPDEIVQLAEETGLIVPVSEWILRTACQNLKKWHSIGFTNLTIAMNCSARQFKQTNLADDILKILTETGVSPKSLVLEVTEKLIMEDPDSILRTLYALKDLGVNIAIDDFGTGYWSLDNLRKLSVDQIKIDKTFIKQCPQDEMTADIVKAIIAMMKKLDIKSVAEGVETREQYEFLLNEGCTEVQGYYLTQPLQSDALTLFLKHPEPEGEAVAKDKKSDILV